MDCCSLSANVDLVEPSCNHDNVLLSLQYLIDKQKYFEYKELQPEDKFQVRIHSLQIQLLQKNKFPSFCLHLVDERPVLSCRTFTLIFTLSGKVG